MRVCRRALGEALVDKRSGYGDFHFHFRQLRLQGRKVEKPAPKGMPLLDEVERHRERKFARSQAAGGINAARQVQRPGSVADAATG